MIARNTLLNLLGFAIPMVIAVAVIPLMIEALGIARFGMLTIIWAIISYFGVFDLGMSRAMTLRVSQLRGARSTEEIASLVGQAHSLLLLGGVLICVVCMCAAPYLSSLLAANLGDELERELTDSMRATAVALPAVMAWNVLRGSLEGFGAFGSVNALRILMGSLLFLLPLAAVQLGGTLVHVAIVLALVRIVGWAMAWLRCRSLLSNNRLIRKPVWHDVRDLLVSGFWITVSSVFGPLISFADRFVIGWLLGMAAVAYFATPNEIITKLWLLPGALTAALFPQLSSYIHKKRLSDLRTLFWTAQKVLVLMMLPVSLVLVVAANEILAVWINRDFAATAGPLLSVLAASMIVNSFAQVPFTLIQSAGRANLAATFHAVAIAPYIAALVVAGTHWGLLGIAWVWLIRLSIDCVFMVLAAEHVTGAIGCRGTLWIIGSATFVTMLAMLLSLLPGLDLRMFAAVATVLLAVTLTYKFTASIEERAWILSALRLRVRG